MKPELNKPKQPQKLTSKLKVVSKKRERFLALAESRMGFALTRIRIVGQLFSPNYEWTESEAQKMIETLEEAVTNVKLKANKKSRDSRDIFKL
jgi:hypothetical protein